MKKQQLFLITAAIAMTLVGCGSAQDVDTTTVSVDKKGVVIQTIVSDFDKEYYSADELKSQIEEEIAQYNGGSDKVSLEMFENEDGKVKVSMKYAAASDYNGMNERVLFAGKVSDAYSAGYDLSGIVKQEDQSVLSSTEVLELGDKNVLICEEAFDVVLPGKITYASEGVNVYSDKKATLPDDGEKLSYVIYE